MLNGGCWSFTAMSRRVFLKFFHVNHFWSLLISHVPRSWLLCGLIAYFSVHRVWLRQWVMSGRTTPSLNQREGVTVSLALHLLIQIRCTHPCFRLLGLPRDSFLRLWIFIFAFVLSAIPIWSHSKRPWNWRNLFQTSLLVSKMYLPNLFFFTVMRFAALSSTVYSYVGRRVRRHRELVQSPWMEKACGWGITCATCLMNRLILSLILTSMLVIAKLLVELKIMLLCTLGHRQL